MATIGISDSIWQKAKIKAAVELIKLKDVADELFKMWVDEKIKLKLKKTGV